MSELDISLFQRVLPDIHERDPYLAGQIQEALVLANSNREDSDEDHILTSDEIQSRLPQLTERSRGFLSILSRNPQQLTGSIGERTVPALERRSNFQGLSPQERARFGQRLQHAAARDGNPYELSLAEINLLKDALENEISQATPENYLRNVRNALSQVEDMARIHPEILLPETEAARRSPINIEFLRSFGAQELNILQQTLQGLNSGTINLRDPQLSPQVREAILILDFVVLSGINIWDPAVRHDRRQTWQISISQLETHRSQSPQDSQAELPPLEHDFANLRAIAYRYWAGRIALANQGEQIGIDVSPLLGRPAELASNLGVQVLINAAGRDHTLTAWEAELLVSRQHLRDPNFETNAINYMSVAEHLVNEFGHFDFQIDEHPELTPGANRIDQTNRTVLRDLGYMINGAGNYDSHLIENSFFTNLIHGVTWLCTRAIYPISRGISEAADITPRTRESDILPAWGLPTIMEYWRDGADENQRYRNRAANFISHVMGYEFNGVLQDSVMPEIETRRFGPDRFFHEWLADQPEGEREVNVANALEYMRTYETRFNAEVQQLMQADPSRNSVTARGMLYSRGMETPETVTRYHEVLTGPLCRLDRLNEIRNMTDRGEAETAWFEFAQQIEGRTWSFFGSHTWDDNTGSYWRGRDPRGTSQFLFTRNLFFSRSIYNAIERQSSNEELRLRANQARQDSLGADITDTDGRVIGDRGNIGADDISEWFRMLPNEQGGEFGFVMPFQWFQNYSLESTDMSIENAITFIPVFRASKWAVSGATTLRASLPLLRQGLFRLLGVQTARAGTRGSLGIFSGAVSNFITNLGRGTVREATEAAGREATQAVQRSAAEQTARIAVASRSGRGTWQIIRDGWREVHGIGDLWHFVGHARQAVTHGVKNLGARVLQRYRTSRTGQSSIGQWVDRAVVGTLESPHARRSWQGFRRIANWENFFAYALAHWVTQRQSETSIAVDSESGQVSAGGTMGDGRLLENRDYRLGLPAESGNDEDSVDMNFTIDDADDADDTPNPTPPAVPEQEPDPRYADE